MAIRISARKGTDSPFIEVVYHFTPNDKPKVLFLNLRQARELSISLDAAVDESIRGRS